MPHPLKPETVFERAKRNGGYLASKSHPIMKKLDYLQRTKEAVDRTGPEGESKTAEKPVVKAKLTLDEKRRKVAEALSGKFATKKGLSGLFVKDLTDEAAVFEQDGKLKACTYRVKGGKIDLGAPFDVETHYVPVDSEGE